MSNHKVIYDDSYMESLKQKNAEKLERAKSQLGAKWLLHPSNKIEKKIDVNFILR